MKKFNVYLISIILIVAGLLGIMMTETVNAGDTHTGSIYINNTLVYLDTDDTWTTTWVVVPGFEWYYGVTGWHDINLKIDNGTDYGHKFCYQIGWPNPIPPGWTVNIYDNDIDEGPFGTYKDIDGQTITDYGSLDFHTRYTVEPPLSGIVQPIVLSVMIQWGDFINSSDGSGSADEGDAVILNLTGIVSPAPFKIKNDDITDALEDTPYSTNYNTYTQNDIATWSLDTDATWLTIDQDGFLNGTPLNQDVGSCRVNVSVDNGTLSDFHNFTIIVENTPPLILTASINTTNEDELYAVIYECSDTGGIEWSVNTTAAWLGIDQASGNLSGVPGNDDTGNYTVNISVHDGNGGYDHIVYNLTVLPVNDAPVIIGAPVFDAYEDAPYFCVFEVTDVDSTIFQWHLSTDADFISLTGSDISGIGDNDDVGRYWINITVSDGDLYDFINYTMILHNTNDAPTWLDTPDNITLNENDTYIFDVNATDIDIGDELAYSLSGPVDMDIDTITGLIEWKSAEPGNHTVIVTASDGQIEIDHTFLVVVIPKPVDNNNTNNTNITDDDDILPDNDDINMTDDDMITDDDINVTDDIPNPDDDIIIDDDVVIADDDITLPDNTTDPVTGSEQELNWLLMSGIIIIVLIVLIAIIIVIFIIIMKKQDSKQREDHYPIIPPIEAEIEYSPGSPGIQPQDLAQAIEAVLKQQPPSEQPFQEQIDISEPEQTTEHPPKLEQAEPPTPKQIAEPDLALPPSPPDEENQGEYPVGGGATCEKYR